ncbi:ankyrin repeat domain-containing protein [Aquitalea palustris]|uniref:ankyrin repeat domain-containing protein n=1 Tax=Aquitalea palustris TaxID=2480983 RepID=UPI001CF07EB5|nr:ankyrin repeat domain-containing protein [Aquitalea palustris]
MSAVKELFEMLGKGDFTTAQKHIELHKLDVDTKDTLIGGVTPLLYAVGSDNKEFAQWLIENGADVNRKYSGTTLLHTVKSAEMAETLINAGAKVNVTNSNSPEATIQKGTPLHYAVIKQDPALMELLIARGANINAVDASRRTPLHYAEARSEKLAAILLQHGANTEMRDFLNETPADLRNRLIENGELKASTAVEPQTQGSVEPSHEQVREGDKVDQVVEEQQPAVALGEGSIRQAAPRQKTVGTSQAASPAGSATSTQSGNDDELIIKNASPQQQNTQASEKKKEMPKRLLGGQFLGNEKGEYRRIGEERVALFDDGDQIRFNDKQMDTFKAGVELAKEKGWSAIEVQGNERFRREAWLHAQASGIEVIGYEPNEKDLKDLEQLQQRQASESIAPAIEASLEEAKGFVLANGKGFVSPNERDGTYAGTVLGETEHHVIVSVDGRAGTATAIQKDKLEGLKVKPGEVLKAQFRDGKLQKSPEKSQSQSRSLTH